MGFSERMTVLGEDIEQGREYLAFKAIYEELLDLRNSIGQLRSGMTDLLTAFDEAKKGIYGGN